MKTKGCFCFVFILSMIASSFGRPKPQFDAYAFNEYRIRWSKPEKYWNFTT